MTSAKARGTDVLLVDTAGRLHTKAPLMDELKGEARHREGRRRLDETLLVLDATTGQNGIAQARAFTEAVELTGMVLTKMDGAAKAGSSSACARSWAFRSGTSVSASARTTSRPFRAEAFADGLLRS